jgi:hypothetical protein
LKHALEKLDVLAAIEFALNVVGAPDGPGVHGRVDVGKVPFVGGDLAVGMEVPFAGEDVELFFGEFGVDHGEGDAVECHVPGGEEGVFPFVGLQRQI